MSKPDLVSGWLDNVAYSHSRSRCTDRYCRYILNLFCEFVGKQPDEIVAEYEGSGDREFKRAHQGNRQGGREGVIEEESIRTMKERAVLSL